jgi:hypothetical protein
MVVYAAIVYALGAGAHLGGLVRVPSVQCEGRWAARKVVALEINGEFESNLEFVI